MSATATVAREWWKDHREIAALIRHLRADARIDDEQIAYLVEKPWKFDPEYQEMVREERETGVVA